MKGNVSVLAVLCLTLSANAQLDCKRGDCFNIHSACVYPNGDRYEGEFYEGQPHGLGALAYSNGDLYIGHFKYKKKHGKGRLKFANGDHYLGAFDNNQHHGYGEMRYANGNFYKGYWVSDAPHGKGNLVFASGEAYEGDFATGMFHGQGRMKYQNGSSYQGQWQYNQRHGRGRLTNGHGKIKDGWWENDEYVSDHGPFGVKDLEDPDTAFLRNCNIQFCMEGRGAFTYRNGTHYVGDFLQGIPEGRGKVFYNNGDKYEGGWAKSLPQGLGVMYYKSGQIVKAVWQAGRPDPILEEFGDKGQSTSMSPTQDQTRNTVKIWAVIIGAAQYKHMPVLRYTDDDAYQLYAFLRSPQGGAVNDEQITLLIDEEATRTGILDAMRNTYRKADENDVIIFYFSGHGIEGSFLPTDFDGVNNKLSHLEIKRTVEQSKAKHKLVVADACHAGSEFFRRSVNAQEIIKKYYTAFEETNGGLALLMSSKGEEYSLEDSGLRSGVFSHFFIKGLKGAADNDSSGIISINEIYRYVHQNVRIYTGNVQTPLLLGTFDKRMPIGAVY